MGEIEIMSVLFSAPWKKSTGCFARSTETASTGAKRPHTWWLTRIAKSILSGSRETGINVEEMMAAGQLEVQPWTDMYVRDHRFDQDAMLA